VELLVADATKARKELDWSPRVSFRELVRIMVDADMEAEGLQPPGEGKAVLSKYGPAFLSPLAATTQVRPRS
jgi:GDPmannose 4,6-dehydratase